MKPVFHFGCGLVLGAFIVIALLGVWTKPELTREEQIKSQLYDLVQDKLEEINNEREQNDSPQAAETVSEKESVSPSEETSQPARKKPAERSVSRPAARSEAPKPVSSRSSRQQSKKSVQYTEVQWGGKEYKLYIGMPKEEVRALIGKPDNVDMMTIGDEVHESWNYRLNIHMLMLSFVDGKLEGIHQI